MPLLLALAETLLGHAALHDIALVLDHLSLPNTREAIACSAGHILWHAVEASSPSYYRVSSGMQ